MKKEKYQLTWNDVKNANESIDWTMMMIKTMCFFLSKNRNENWKNKKTWESWISADAENRRRRRNFK